MTQEISECTFKPSTTKAKKFQNVPSTYNFASEKESKDFSEKLKEKLKEKQQKIVQERREREYEVMKECTFKP